MKAFILAGWIWLRFTTPSFEAIPGSCDPSLVPTDRLDQATLFVDFDDGSTWIFGSHPAAAPGAPDSFRVLFFPGMSFARVAISDSAGNVSCLSNPAALRSTTSVDSDPAPEPRAQAYWFDLLGRRLDPGELRGDGRPRRPGVYFLKRRGSPAIKRVVLR